MIVEIVVVVVQQTVASLIILLIVYYVVCVVAKLCEALVLLWNKIKKHLKWILPCESHQHAYTDAPVCSVCYTSSTTTFTCPHCNTARYCSVQCQIRHRRRCHEYECIEEKEATDDGVQRAAAESRPLMEVAHNNSTATTVCFVCYTSSTTFRCSRCKAVRYCSGQCQIIHWRQGHRYECLEKNKSTDNRVKRPADYGFEADEAHEPNNNKQTSTLGDTNSYDWSSFSEDKFSLFMTSSSSEEGNTNTNTNPKPLIGNSEEATKKDHEQNEERMRYLEDELEKYKNEVEQLKSERDKWERQTSFVSRRLSSLMREYDEHKIAEEARVIQRRKQDEHIHKLEKECAKLKRDLKEERKLVQRLKVEKDDEAEMAKRKVHEISQELAGAYRDVEYATARADNAENLWIKAKRELEEERELLELLKLKCEETTRQVQKKELELANALKAVAAAEAKLSDLEKEMNSSNDETCAICLTNEKDMAFGCGHMTCADCGVNMSICPICREQITIHLKLFPG